MNQYEESLYPMVPLGNDAVFDQYNIPFSHCEYRLMVNRDFADSYYQEYGNVQFYKGTTSQGKGAIAVLNAAKKLGMPIK